MPVKFGVGETGLSIVNALSANGIDTVFGIPGTHNLELYRYLESSGIRHVLCRHEQAAAYAADGYFRATQRVAAVFVTSGPGLLNATAGIANAYSDRVPILVISPVIELGRERRDLGWMHEVKDQRSAFSHIAEWSETARDADDAVALINRACYEWRTIMSRPVVIHIPYDVLLSETKEIWKPTLNAPSKISFSESDFALFQESVRGACKPMVIVGGGCIADYLTIRVALEQLGAPVILTSRGKGVLPDGHTLSLGVTLGTQASKAALQQADLVLLIGTELSEAEMMDTQLILSGIVIRVDHDINQLHHGVRADIPICSDAGNFAVKLIKEKLSFFESALSFKQLSLQLLAETTQLASEFSELFTVCSEVLPPNTRIVGDSSQVSYIGTTHRWKSIYPDQVLQPIGFATLGYGLPAAVGALLGDPTTPTVCLVGDGALMFSLQELGTAAELQHPLPVLVWDNSGFAEIRQQMMLSDILPVAVDINTPNIQDIAISFGCRAYIAKDATSLRKQLSEALNTPGPTVIHIEAKTFVGGGQLPEET